MTSEPPVATTGDGAAEDGALLVYDHDPWLKQTRQLLGMLDAPAYLRRALRVERAIDAARRRCITRREDLAGGARLRLKAWRRIVALDPGAAEKIPGESLAWIESLWPRLFPAGDRPELSGNPGRSSRVLRDLIESVERFNQRWQEFARTVDFSETNRLIEGYNRHYLFEKECAVRSGWIAARGYRPLAPLTAEWVLAEYPLLPTPAAPP